MTHVLVVFFGLAISLIRDIFSPIDRRLRQG